MLKGQNESKMALSAWFSDQAILRNAALFPTLNGYDMRQSGHGQHLTGKRSGSEMQVGDCQAYKDLQSPT